MHALAAAERFEEAADVRDRAAALAAALRRQRRFDTLRRAGRVVLEVDGRSGAELLHGRLVRAWRISPGGPTPVPLPIDLDPAAPDQLVAALRRPEGGAQAHDGDLGEGMEPGTPVPKALADELLCVAAWIDRELPRIRVVSADGPLVSPAPPMPTFEPRSVPSVR